MPLDQNEFRVLTEIAHKLDYAIRTAEVPPAAPEPSGAALDPSMLRLLYSLMQPCDKDELATRIMGAVATITNAERGFLITFSSCPTVR